MTASRTANHPWKSLSDEELLRSAGLILKDPERQMEGITLAALLLFGKTPRSCRCCPSIKRMPSSGWKTWTVMMTGT